MKNTAEFAKRQGRKAPKSVLQHYCISSLRLSRCKHSDYYVGLSEKCSFYINYEEGVMEQNFSLLPSEQTAKAIQDIFNKPEEKGGRGWDYYREFLKERTREDIDDCDANVWINRWSIEDGWLFKYNCYEIDLDNGYQDYELTEQRLPWKWECWCMHVLVYKGDRLIEGWEIK